MVEERITDGRRIAELLAAELDGRADGGLERVAVTNADRDIEATPDGARAYDVERDDRRLARVVIYDDRVRLVFEAGEAAALEAASEAGLETGADGDDSVVVVESAAAVKRATRAVQAAGRAVGPSSSEKARN